MTPRPFVLVICGPTASGKSALALDLAARVPLEVINADSMQIYRGMDIGTAKPGPVERRAVPHHLLDIRNPDEPFSAGEYTALFTEAAGQVVSGRRLPVAVGGTGLYIRAALRGIFPGPPRDPEIRKRLRTEERADPGALYRRLQVRDPDSAARILPGDEVRIVRALEVLEVSGRTISDLQREHSFGQRPFRCRMFCLSPPRKMLYGWIDDRVERMMTDGLLEEVRGLLDHGYGPDLTSMKGLGYRELTAHLMGGTGLDEAVALVKRNTRRYAKRQVTWFRGEDGVEWLEYGSREDLPKLAERIAEEVRGECAGRNKNRIQDPGARREG